jgi:hypothetical protein
MIKVLAREHSIIRTIKIYDMYFFTYLIMKNKKKKIQDIKRKKEKYYFLPLLIYIVTSLSNALCALNIVFFLL